MAFSLNFSSSSAFLRSLFTQSSHLSCDLPRFLYSSGSFVSDLFGNLWSFIVAMCPTHLIRLLTILPCPWHYNRTFQELCFNLLIGIDCITKVNTLIRCNDLGFDKKGTVSSCFLLYVPSMLYSILSDSGLTIEPNYFLKKNIL